MIFRLARYLALFIFLSLMFAQAMFAATSPQARAASVALRSFEQLAAGRWQIIVPLPRLVDYSVFALNDPERIVIDLLDAQMIPAACKAAGGPILRCRTGRVEGARARFVLDVSARMKIASASLEAAKSGFFLKVIFVRADGAHASSRQDRPKIKSVKAIDRAKHRVIIIDPGHGGGDIGSSFSGVDEKDLMLLFARELRDELAAHRGFSVFLTRNEDEFVSLRDRVLRARRYHADALISLHADWNADPKVHGVAVYSLSNHSADKYARIFLESNGAAIIGGEEWRGGLPSAHDILFDLTQRENLGKSVALGRNLLKSMRRFAPLLDQPHRFADFHVLSAPDLPAVLIETGFLSNAGDMKKLKTKIWRRRFAAQIIKGLRAYFKQVSHAGL